MMVVYSCIRIHIERDMELYLAFENYPLSLNQTCNTYVRCHVLPANYLTAYCCLSNSFS